MRGWYNIHDYENNRLGFVPFPGSSKTTPEEYVEVVEEEETDTGDGDNENVDEDEND